MREQYVIQPVSRQLRPEEKEQTKRFLAQSYRTELLKDATTQLYTELHNLYASQNTPVIYSENTLSNDKGANLTAMYNYINNVGALQELQESSTIAMAQKILDEFKLKIIIVKELATVRAAEAIPSISIIDNKFFIPTTYLPKQENNEVTADPRDIETQSYGPLRNDPMMFYATGIPIMFDINKYDYPTRAVFVSHYSVKYFSNLSTTIKAGKASEIGYFSSLINKFLLHYHYHTFLFSKETKLNSKALYKITELLLQNGADPNSVFVLPEIGKCTTLRLAAMMHNPGIIKLLLDYGADVNEELRYGDQIFASTLYSAIAAPSHFYYNPSESNLRNAYVANKISTIEFLLTHGASYTPQEHSILTELISSLISRQQKLPLKLTVLALKNHVALCATDNKYSFFGFATKAVSDYFKLLEYSQKHNTDFDQRPYSQLLLLSVLAQSQELNIVLAQNVIYRAFENGDQELNTNSLSTHHLYAFYKVFQADNEGLLKLELSPYHTPINIDTVRTFFTEQVFALNDTQDLKILMLRKLIRFERALAENQEIFDMILSYNPEIEYALMLLDLQDRETKDCRFLHEFADLITLLLPQQERDKSSISIITEYFC